MRSGQRTAKPLDLTFHEAVDDPETRAEFIRRALHLYIQTTISNEPHRPPKAPCSH